MMDGSRVGQGRSRGRGMPACLIYGSSSSSRCLLFRLPRMNTGVRVQREIQRDGQVVALWLTASFLPRDRFQFVFSLSPESGLVAVGAAAARGRRTHELHAGLHDRLPGSKLTYRPGTWRGS